MLIFYPLTFPWILGFSTLCKANLTQKMVFPPFSSNHNSKKFDGHGLSDSSVRLKLAICPV